MSVCTCVYIPTYMSAYMYANACVHGYVYVHVFHRYVWYVLVNMWRPEQDRSWGVFHCPFLPYCLEVRSLTTLEAYWLRQQAIRLSGSLPSPSHC